MTGTEAGTRARQDSRLWDFLAGLPLMLLCAFGIAGIFIQVHRQWPGAGSVASVALIAESIRSRLALSFGSLSLTVTLSKKASTGGRSCAIAAMAPVKSSRATAPRADSVAPAT